MRLKSSLQRNLASVLMKSALISLKNLKKAFSDWEALMLRLRLFIHLRKLPLNPKSLRKFPLSLKSLQKLPLNQKNLQKLPLNPKSLRKLPLNPKSL